MPYQQVKFYQAGSFVAGNRLLDPEQRTVQARSERSNTLTCGHRACRGCGEALGARYALDAAMRAADNKLIATNATGCLEVFSTPYPESSWQLPWIHSLFGNAPAVATGVAAALRAKGREDVRVIGQGGDGGTVDIGFGCLSGMFERNDDVLFVCYDNEAYMNTGVQRSGATPPAVRTANTKPVGEEPGNVFGQGKSAPLIAMAHEIPYVATATVADLRDIEAKVARAMELHGARYIHILVTCPLGWGCGSGDSVKVARRQNLVESEWHLRGNGHPTRPYPVDERALEVGLAPGAETGVAIRRDVRALHRVGGRIPGLRSAGKSALHHEGRPLSRRVAAVAGHHRVDEIAAALQRRLRTRGGKRNGERTGRDERKACHAPHRPRRIRAKCQCH